MTPPTNEGQSSPSRPMRDAEATRQNILDAAEEEFSRHGLQGARMGAIARGAGVTTAMLHYYFENKEGLYRMVLERPAVEVSDTMSQLNLGSLPPLQAMEAFVRAAIAYEARYPQRGMLWFQEANQNRGEFFKLSKSGWVRVAGSLNRILERGIKEGVFRPLDPSLTTVHILGVCIFYFNIHENWKHLVPEVDRLGPERVRAHQDAAVSFVLAGLAPYEN